MKALSKTKARKLFKGVRAKESTNWLGTGRIACKKSLLGCKVSDIETWEVKPAVDNYFDTMIDNCSRVHKFEKTVFLVEYLGNIARVFADRENKEYTLLEEELIKTFELETLWADYGDRFFCNCEAKCNVDVIIAPIRCYDDCTEGIEIRNLLVNLF